MEKKRRDTRAMEAFLRYARYGFARREEDVFAIYDAICGCCGRGAEARRMLAVCETLRFLRTLGRTDAERAVRAVYFFGRGRRLRRNEISLRVRRFADEYYLDDRTVYRHLADAKRLFLQLLDSYAGEEG